MFHPHLSTGITKYWDAQSVKDQLALDNLFVHTEIIIKKYMDNFQSDDSSHTNGKGKGKGTANNTETGNGKGGRARSQSAETKTHADEEVGYKPERRGSEPNVKPTPEADRKANGHCKKFYNTGKCWFGSKCKFEHVNGPEVDSENTHSARSAKVSAPSSQQEAKAIRKRILQLEKERVQAQKELSKLEGTKEGTDEAESSGLPSESEESIEDSEE